jgi:hypothetical protein
MMPSCSCFARRVKPISDNTQVIVFAHPGYCAWGCFRDFLNLGPGCVDFSHSRAEKYPLHSLRGLKD